MSIDADKFDKHRNTFKYILEFLKNNRDRAFTVEYIAKQIGVGVYEVKNALMWESLAWVIDRTYRSLIESATVEGIVYYKYKSE